MSSCHLCHHVALKPLNLAVLPYWEERGTHGDSSCSDLMSDSSRIKVPPWESHKCLCNNSRPTNPTFVGTYQRVSSEINPEKRFCFLLCCSNHDDFNGQYTWQKNVQTRPSFLCFFMLIAIHVYIWSRCKFHHWMSLFYLTKTAAAS